MEYCLLDDPKGWQEIPLKGGWFPHAFIGSMAALQLNCKNPGIQLPNSTADALQTMKLVETVYKASETGGVPFGKIN